MPISYLEFKLNKELAYQDTFEKDDKIRKEYEEYLKRIHNTKKEDRKRFDKLKELGCIACGSNEPVIHHIRKHTGLSLRPDHQDTIPLCAKHHNMGNESIHLNKKLFEDKFGTEKQLLIKTNMEINQLERRYLFYEK